MWEKAQVVDEGQLTKETVEEGKRDQSNHEESVTGQHFPQCSPADTVTVPELPFSGANKEPRGAPPVIFSLVLCRLGAPRRWATHTNPTDLRLAAPPGLFKPR